MSRSHSQAHAHPHEHAHPHALAPAEAAGTPRAAVLSGRRGLRIALVITVVFLGAEIAGYFLTNSLALLADAGHMLTDAAALALSLLAIRFGARPATVEKSYGYLRLEIVAALFNGIVLVLISGFIFTEAYQRFRDPPRIEVPLMLAIAVAGLFANAASAFFLFRTHCGNLNVRGAYLHVLGDLLGSVGATAAGVIMLVWGWYAADPLISIVVGALILVSAVRLVAQSVDVLLEAVPAHIDLGALERDLAGVEGVRSIHDLHVWTMSSGIYLMTCHAVVAEGEHFQDVLERLNALLREKFGIHHSTIQLEATDLRASEADFCNRK